MKKFLKPFFILSLVYVTIGCIGTKHLKEGEYLLYNQKISTSQKSIKENLNRQLVQKPNSRIWFLPIAPYTYVYYLGLKGYDTTKYELNKAEITTKFEEKIANTSKVNKVSRYRRKLNKKVGKENKKIDEGNLLMRWGEPIVVFDSSEIDKSRRNLDVYMKSNGWFMAEANYEVNYKNRATTVNYSIKDGPRYTIDTVIYDIADTAVRKIVLDSRNKGLIEAGAPYSQDNLSNERERIDELLKNNGYFDFSRQYVRFRIDSTARNQQVIVQLRILRPINLSNHKSFTIDSVNFAVDTKIVAGQKKQEPFAYKGVTYKFSDRYYSEKVLARRIHIKPGEPYSKQNTLNTQRELAGMDMFKFVNINYDSTANQFMTNIFVSPLKRYQWTAEAGLTVTQALPGPFASISLKQRNVFNTLGILEISGNIGVEGVAAASNPDDILASLEAGANVSLFLLSL